MRIALINPNTSEGTTDMMVRIARRGAGAATVMGLTASFGAALITNKGTLATAAAAVEALLPELEGFDAVVVAAFGDPGCPTLRARLRCTVIGIAAASMAEAARGGRPFAVATTTPDLCDVIAARAAEGGHSAFLGTWVTPGDPAALMADPARLAAALGAACRGAVDAGAGAVIIGGGPLGEAADALSGRLPVPLIAPIPAAMRAVLRRPGAMA
jgi:Asp/Glu/hydantoin racemase